MNLQKLILTKNNCYMAGRTIKPRGIMVHATGAPNPSLRRYVNPDDGRLGSNQHDNHWNRPRPEGRDVCVHAFIGRLLDGSVATYQTLPWNHRGWHCGQGPNGSGNDTHISFEICEDGLADAEYFNSVYQEAVELCAYLCDMFDFDPMADGIIIDHAEGHRRGISSNHADVGHWFPRYGKSMAEFRVDVTKIFDSSYMPARTLVTESSDNKVTALPDNRPFRVCRHWQESETQVGAFNIFSNAVDAARANNAEGFKVFDDLGQMIYDPQESVIPYRIRVAVNSLTIHRGPGTDYPTAGSIRSRGVYTIIEESDEPGANRWGRLKSGAGWISLGDTIKV